MEKVIAFMESIDVKEQLMAPETLEQQFYQTLEEWKRLPFSFVRSPVEVAENMPSFVVGEVVFMLLSLVCFIHAWKKGRVYLLVWWASIIVGCANDVFFMCLPGVDNFHHAQGTIMLTPRLPLYILCVYNTFMYCSVTSCFSLQLGAIGNAAVVGLLAELFYSVYDFVGIRFLWWTWHDTDAAISERIFDVPIGSSMWVITFCFSFSFILHIMISRCRTISIFRFIFTIIVLSLFCTPLMMMQMGLYQLSGVMGKPDMTSIMLLVLLYLVIISLKMISTGKWMYKRFNASKIDSILAITISIYFASMSIISVIFTPQNHISTGIHQIIGPCDIMEDNLSGLPRQKYLCSENYDEHFRICSNTGSYSSWYSVCGLPIPYHEQWSLLICILSIIGVTIFNYLLMARRMVITPGNLPATNNNNNNQKNNQKKNTQKSKKLKTK